MKILSYFLAILMLMLLFGSNAFGEESASRAECMEVTQAAADMLLQDKEAGTAEIAKSDGKFVWKDTYVFLMDMEGKMLAHPFVPQLTEKGPLFDVADKNKAEPKMIFAMRLQL